MTTALRKHYGEPGQPTIPPLPPGYTLDRPVTDPALIAQLEGTPLGAKRGMFDDLIPKGRTFDFTSPDGKVYTVTGPEGATVQQAWEILQRQLNTQPAAKPPFDPTQPYQVVADKPPFDPTKPFQAGSAPPKLVPVDHDPFASAAGVRPNPFDRFDPQPGAQNAAQQGRLYVTPEAPKPIERPASILPSSVGGAVRDFQVGAQGVGKGLTDIITGPFDLVAGAQNAAVGGINKLLGTDIPMATPASKLVEKGADAIGVPGIDPATMSRSEKLFYDVNRFGTQAVGTGAMLAQRAPSVATAATRSETVPERILDHMARPYTEAPARTLVGDTIGGAGAGIAVNASDNYVPDDASVFGHYVGHGLKDVTNLVAPLVGASGANTLQTGVETPRSAPARIIVLLHTRSRSFARLILT
ncbi:hypothetical protein [Bradyrhizobium genosp. SA-3]|uniref:hypothetical protein n=1 Tax=Bradyrhizobium genosp. SA-3 TaxID=508868 RepID=UPI0013EEBDF5|nr:hypothetical protein [Bradyrhizobium genosp. SA-3]